MPHGGAPAAGSTETFVLGQFLRRDTSKRGAHVPLTGAAKMGGHTGEERQVWEEGVWVKELAVAQNRILLKAGQWKGISVRLSCQ